MKEKIIVCISCYFKGNDFLDEIKRLGNKVVLITSENLRDKNWVRDSIDEVFYMHETSKSRWNLDHLVHGFSHLMKTRKIDAVVALDDYDVEKAALIRETFRIPGMGQTTHRYFRDKLAMRQQAKDFGINVPEFTAIFNNDEIKDFISRVEAPWVLKPRSEASASGIKKINSEEELWDGIQQLGDERHLFLLESFKPGDVYHVDSLIFQKEIVFSCCSQYLATPMEVSHQGGVFRTRTLNRYSEEFEELQQINAEVMQTFGLQNGVCHSEYIKGKEGKYYFLETSSRVGGAHIPDMVETATGVNLWREWAKIEDALLKSQTYSPPKPTGFFGGLLIALTKEQHPATTNYECEEVAKFIPLDYHIVIVYKSTDENKILTRLDEATQKVTEKLLNVIPPTDKPTS